MTQLDENSPNILFSTAWQRLDDGWCIASRAYARAMREAGIRVNLQDNVDKLTEVPIGVLRELGPEILNDKFHPRLDYHVWSGVLQSWDTMRHTIDSFHRSPVPVGYYGMFERRIIEPELINALKSFSVWCLSPVNADILKGHGLTDVTYIPYPYRQDDPHLSIGPSNNEVPSFYWIGRFEPRKAPDNLIRAFMRAFKPGQARLTMKLSPYHHVGGYENPERVILEVLEFSYDWTPDNWNNSIKIIRERLSSDEMLALHSRNDIYVSASRGEGWELGCWAAKLAGRRIIATESGGPECYLSEDDIRIPTTGFIPTHESYDKLWGKSQYIDYNLEDLITAFQRAAKERKSGNRFWPGHANHLSENVGKTIRHWLEERI